MEISKKAEKLIRQLGANGSYMGFSFIIDAVAKAIEDKSLLLYITKGLYMEVAAENHTSVKCVERNIRTVTEIIWKYGDRELLNKIAGRNLEEKPNNREFIDMLVRYLSEEEEKK